MKSAEYKSAATLSNLNAPAAELWLKKLSSNCANLLPSNYGPLHLCEIYNFTLFINFIATFPLFTEEVEVSVSEVMHLVLEDT